MLEKQFFRPQSKIVQHKQSIHRKISELSPKLLQMQKLNSFSPITHQKKVQPNSKLKGPCIGMPSGDYTKNNKKKINNSRPPSIGSPRLFNHSKSQKISEKTRNKMKNNNQNKQDQQNIQKLKKKYFIFSQQQNTPTIIYDQQKNIKDNYLNQKDNNFIAQKDNNFNIQKLQCQPDYIIAKSQNIQRHYFKTENCNKNTSKNKPHLNSNNQPYVNPHRKLQAPPRPRICKRQQRHTQNNRLMSPSSEYYSIDDKNNPSNKTNQFPSQVLAHQGNNEPQLRRNPTNYKHLNRTSSLTLSKFRKNSMLTFYQCDIKNFYKYNDEGFHTDRQVVLRQKVQKTAKKALYKLITQQEEQYSAAKLHKNKSASYFLKFSRLKEEVQKQRIKKQSLNKNFQNHIYKNIDFDQLKPKSPTKLKLLQPSSLPRSNSLSKNKEKNIQKGDFTHILQASQRNNEFSYDNQKRNQEPESAKSITTDKKNQSGISKFQSQKDLLYQDYEIEVQSNLQMQQPNRISKIAQIHQYFISQQEKQNNFNMTQQSNPTFVGQSSQRFKQHTKNQNKNNSCGNISHHQKNLIKQILTPIQCPNSIFQQQPEPPALDRIQQSQYTQNSIEQSQHSLKTNSEVHSLQSHSNLSLKSNDNLDKIPLKSNQIKANPHRNYNLQQYEDHQNELMNSSKIKSDSQNNIELMKESKISINFESDMNKYKSSVDQNQINQLSQNQNNHNQYFLDMKKKSKPYLVQKLSIQHQINLPKQISKNLNIKSIFKENDKDQLQSSSSSGSNLSDRFKPKLKSNSFQILRQPSQHSNKTKGLANSQQLVKSQSKFNHIIRQSKQSEKNGPAISHPHQKADNQEKRSLSKIQSQKQLHHQKFCRTIRSKTNGFFQIHKQGAQNSMNFNFVRRAEEILQIEDDLNQKRRSMEDENQMAEEFEDFLAKIEGHTILLRQILLTSTDAIQIYSSQSAWVFKSCLLSLKKYNLERNRVVDSLKGKKSCFKIAENELTEQEIKQFLNDEEIKLIVQDMKYCNQLNEKLIEDFLEFLKFYFENDFSQNQFNLNPFDDRFDLGILLQEYCDEIVELRQKTYSQQNAERIWELEAFDEQTQEVMKKRIFKLMEVTFLLSELAGKRIKEFQEEIDIKDEFEDYYSDYWPYFERIVKTFS